MRGAAERGHLVLGLGDFNMVPRSLAHQLIIIHAPVCDAWMVLHPECSLGAASSDVEKARRRPIPTASHNLLENGATCDSVLNTWRWNKGQQRRIGPNKPRIEIPGDTIDAEGRRLDYIFASTGLNIKDPSRGGWIVKSARVGMLDRHPELQCSLSDHFSVEATLVHSNALDLDAESALRKGAYLDSSGLGYYPANELALQFRHDKPPYLPVSTYDEILAMVHHYTHRERFQRRARMWHFLASIPVSIACLTGVFWVPHNYVAFILMLVSSLNFAAGVIDGLVGGLFMSSEIRALKEFEWEIRNTRAAAGGEPHVIEDEVFKDV